ncbi:MAG: hypothetical protein NTU73_03555, partial [Ignavibacteriae bacterium]|nr:hypothetical protein [Ignavibacteriota bacterium]
ELLKCIYLLGVLKSSDNLLKDIYTISRIRNLKNLGNYLFFILKKTETGEIKFDNLLENITLDKEFVLNELLNCFSIDNSIEAETGREYEKEKPKKEETKEEKISTEIKRILAESKFKVEEIDNELVTEEFIESDINEDNDVIVRGNYLELLQPESGLEDASVFSLPTNKGENEIEDDIQIEENDVFALPGKSKDEEKENPVEEFLADQVNIEEIEEVKLDKIEAAAAAAAVIAGAVTGVGEEAVAEAEKEEANTEITGEEKEEIPQEIVSEEDFEEPGIPKEEVPDEIEEEEKTTVEKTEEKLLSEEKETDELKESVEIAEVENSFYMKYETELLTSNVLLRNNLGEIGGLKPEDENYSDRKNILIKEIVDSSKYMEEYSKKMSFEVITSIYGIMNMTFSTYGKTVGSEIIAMFKDSINLVESLIKGEDFAGYDNVMKSLDVLKHTLLDIRREERKEEIPEEDKDDLDKHLMTKEFNTNERQKLAALKQNILDVENVFKSIEDIKGKFQAYEALRRLSHTFAHFKELVSTANSLEMRKLAQLAEASYIFVKFIQNYRMNPFESEITEVFKYIIYNFKLIFLDKPTKDIDLLISYLNDPVKIFEKKEKE